MKRLGYITAIIFALIIVGIAAINIRQEDTDITKNQTKVGFILNGTIDDGSWGQAHYEGMEISRKELNLAVEYRENVPMDHGCISVMEELIADGCKIIVCNSYEYGSYALQVASRHRDICFFHATGVTEASNLSTYFGRIYQMRYLCGIVAGMQTETDEIGYIAAYDISEVNRGINAFTLGVKSVNPNAKVYVQFCETWLDDELTRKAAEELFDRHEIDVMTVHSDSLSAYEVADERDIWIIGYNRDNSDKYPEHFLTAAVWNWENFYTPKIREVLQDKFVGRRYWEGVESGIVSLSPFTEHVSQETRQLVEQGLERMEEGTFDVFYGPIYDRDGRIRVAEGESMTDDAMLNSFDWYVDGVVIDEE
ncbi:MAG: BMP family ABC transporter substrate-binding protein [Acetatifactor sp.]